MDVLALAKSLAIAIALAAPLALIYRHLKRGDPNVAANAWKVFATLTAIIAARVYAIG